MDFSGPNRNTMILAFILLALGAVALLESSALVVLILLGLLFLVRQFDNNQVNTRYQTGQDENYEYGSAEYEDEYDYELEARSMQQPQSEPVYRHALEAVTRAGLDPDTVQVLVTDVGMMTFKGNDSPTVYRTWGVPDDVDYVQPFVQLRLPSKAKGRIKFEVLDSAGKPVFIHEDVHNLERGRNFITPAARLPIHDEREFEGKWRLRVSADGLLLAEHRFEFAEAHTSDIQRHIGEDGEINTELRAVITENRLPKMSLDDLLAYQGDDEQQQAGKK
jgi:hypothetical protein